MTLEKKIFVISVEAPRYECMVYFTRTDVLKKKEKATELLNPEFIFELVSLQDRNPTKVFQRMEAICVTIGGYARSHSFYL